VVLTLEWSFEVLLRTAELYGLSPNVAAWVQAGTIKWSGSLEEAI
jgi:hypothetical protein